MTAARILLLGAAGQVGQALQHQPKPASWDFILHTHTTLDLINHSSVRDEIQRVKPDLIINAAGLTNVDQAEKNPDLATATNFNAVANLAAQCSQHDIPLIHLSTDYVFDGTQTTPYFPDDAMNPVNIYGSTKLMGEEAVRHTLAWHVILRISSVFSAYGQNILTKTLKLIDERDELRMVTDQLSCPTPAPDAAAAIITIAAALLKGGIGNYGTFHYCGMPTCTRYELTEAIMAAYAPYTRRRAKITPTVSAEFAGMAPRPAYTVMDCSKTRQIFGISQPSWQDGITAAMKQLMQDRSPNP